MTSKENNNNNNNNNSNNSNSRPALSEREIALNSYATTVTCADEYKKFMDEREEKKNPQQMAATREALEKCFMRTHVVLTEHCAAQMEALSSCLVKNRSATVRCGDMVKALQKCALKNDLPQ